MEVVCEDCEGGDIGDSAALRCMFLSKVCDFRTPPTKV